MPYPVFEIGSIKDRCKLDIENFNKNFGSDAEIKVELDDTSKDITIMKDTINKILTKFNEVGITDIKTFDYAGDIIKFNETPLIQSNIWRLRTYLFYQLLIFATQIMSNEELFNNVYVNYNKRTDFSFRTDVVNELPNFKLGIFGSITPTSDIDIGIQYSGKAELVALDYVVSIVEDMFIIFVGIESSLKMDIETYADMMTLPNPNIEKDPDHPDLFYLDNINFTSNEFNQMLPYIGASILRNYVTAIKETTDKVDVKQILDNLPTDFWDKINKKLSDDLSGNEKLLADTDLSGNDWRVKSKEMVVDYMSMTYEDAREHYYKYVKDAELSTQRIRGQLQTKVAIVQDDIINAMVNIAKALVYRAESYTCAPTVMHVVRVLQAKPDPEKHPVTYPSCIERNTPKYTEAICEIGKYGYLMSMMEQKGYLDRFDITYCQDKQLCDKPDCEENHHRNINKCTKKNEKYQDRYTDAIDRLNSIPSNIPTTVGGFSMSSLFKRNKKSQRFTKKRKQRKTRKFKKRMNKSSKRNKK